MLGRFMMMRLMGASDPFAPYCNKDSGGAAAQDYTKLAAASERAAELGYELGNNQLTENARQYDQNMAVAQPIIDAQTQLMGQAYEQGNNNYNTFQSEGRPVQQAMLYDALGLTPDEIAQYNTMRSQEIETANSNRTAGLAQAGTSLQGALNGLSSATSATSTSTQSPGMYQLSDGTLVGTNYSAKRPEVSTSGSVVGRLVGLGAQSAYDKALEQDPKDGSILIGKVPTDADGSYVPGAQNYSWVKPYSSQTGGSNSAQSDAMTKAIESVGGAVKGLSSSSGSSAYGVDNSASSTFLAQQATKAKQRQLDEAAGTAIADARSGTTQQQNQLIRQGLRYGWSPAKIASMGTSAAMGNARTMVSAANQARTQADAKRTAKLGDVYNTYAGLGSNAPAFYQAGTQAGNSAVNNQNQTSAQYINGMSSGNQTIMQGQGIRAQGLGSVLSSQSAMGSVGGTDNTGAVIGGVASIAAAFI